MHRPLSVIAITAFLPWQLGCASIPPRPGATPRLEAAVAFVAPQLPQAEAPGLAGSIAFVLPRTSTWGLGIVGDAEAAYLMGTATAGVRIYRRTTPLYAEHRVLSYFGQILVGHATGSVSGVLHSEGGTVLEPDLGLDYGSGRYAFHLQAGYRQVANGVVYDSRVPGGPTDQLSGLRVVIGMTWRMLSR